MDAAVAVPGVTLCECWAAQPSVCGTSPPCSRRLDGRILAWRLVHLFILQRTQWLQWIRNHAQPQNDRKHEGPLDGSCWGGDFRPTSRSQWHDLRSEERRVGKEGRDWEEVRYA